MKQHLQIKHLYGTSERAVYNQVWISLIVFCLLVRQDGNESRTQLVATNSLAQSFALEALFKVVRANETKANPNICWPTDRVFLSFIKQG